jgi:small-conductance mechanosensitive channel
MTIEAFLEDLQNLFAWAPPWVFGLLLVAAALAAALAVHEALVRLVRRGLANQDEFWRALVVRTRGPGRLALMVAAVAGALAVAPVLEGQDELIRHGLLVAIIVLFGWMVLTAVDIGSALYMRRYRTDVADNLLARKHLTQVRVLKRAAATLVILVTTGLALMTIPEVRQWGVSLLAAGGAAGIIVGLSMQPLISNLIAGIQIATTQPIRLDDAVIVEGEFGRIEEIKATYVVVRLWDERRMVLPLTYFLQTPFQNWTRETSQLLGTVMLYLDYATPVEALRPKLAEILEASSYWDRRVGVVHVTDAREGTMEVRLLVSAGDSGALSDLRNEVREKMISWLQADLPDALPRQRMELRAPEGWTGDPGTLGDGATATRQ